MDVLIVLKIGGSLNGNFKSVCADIKRLYDMGEKLVVVHGGGEATNELSRRLGIEVEKVVSPSGFESRRTTKEVLEVFVMACAGKINRFLVAELQRVGVQAIGLSGADGRLVEAERKIIKALTPDGKVKVIKDDYSGKIERINVSLLNELLNMGFVPVIAPLAFSPSGDLLNVDGDTLASKVALSLGSESLVILSDVPGLLRDLNDPNSLIREVSPDMEGEILEIAKGRMKKKVMALLEAIKGGVERGIIASGYQDSPIISALGGNGTVFRGRGGVTIEPDRVGREIWKWSISQGALEVS